MYLYHASRRKKKYSRYGRQTIWAMRGMLYREMILRESKAILSMICSIVQEICDAAWDEITYREKDTFEGRVQKPTIKRNQQYQLSVIIQAKFTMTCRMPRHSTWRAFIEINYIIREDGAIIEPKIIILLWPCVRPAGWYYADLSAADHESLVSQSAFVRGTMTPERVAGTRLGFTSGNL